MSKTISVYLPEFNYKFQKYGKNIIINGKEFNTDITKIENKQEKNECISSYKDYVKSGKSKEYAKVKASLFFAPYIEVGLAPPIELMDYIVMYLLGFESAPELKSDMHLNITDTEVYVLDKTKEKSKKINHYSMATTGSSHISYDYEALLKALINDHNAI